MAEDIHKKLYFVSNNEDKYREICEISKKDGINIVQYSEKIPELQTEDSDELIKDKARKAFEKLRRPLIVEHTALKIEALNELPGLLTSLFYKKLQYSGIVEICKVKKKDGATVQSIFCYCDGKNLTIAKGEERGRIVDRKIEEGHKFDWDRIFAPEKDNPDYRQTYAEMPPEVKNARSMRKKAWDELMKTIPSNAFADYRLENGDHADAAGDIIEPVSEMKKLAKYVKERKVLLFVGAGISASLGLPTWNSLLNNLGKDAGFDPEIFESYGDNIMRAEYLKGQTGIDVYQYMKDKLTISDKVRVKLENSSIYKAIFELDFPVIYTTNYDHAIEEYYRIKGGDCYNKIVTIDQMETVKPGKTRIMKFHGDIDDKESMVFTEREYFGRMDFQSFLDIQLQADLLQYHVLFLGYSLSDINIKMLLYIARKRRENAKQSEPMEDYIFTATPNEVQKFVFSNNRIVSLTGQIAGKKEATQAFLTQLCAIVTTNL